MFMEFLPIAVNVEGMKVVVIGGGRTAEHKIKAISLYTRNITIVAPEVSDILAGQGYSVIKRRYEPSVIEGAFLVYACTDDHLVNQTIAVDAKTKNILVNVCDRPSLSTFVSPALYKKEHMSVAVTSNGRDVHKSIRWRNRIREHLENDQA